jgi:hypothetical protein
LGMANPSFAHAVDRIDSTLAAQMRSVSWHPGCPVAISELRLVTMNHWGFDGEPHPGELVVHEAVAADVVAVFGQLYAARFPIARMQRIDAYGGDDDASMAADNTSAFNCRVIAGTDSLSIHSWGMAIDINPVENPYVRDDAVQPPASADFLDRDDVRPGMIVDGDAVVQAFAGTGFTWGGHWQRLKDYQHFEIADPPSRLARLS